MAVPFSNTKLRVPKGFQNVLEGLAREILRSQPANVFQFGATYFENLLKIREETGNDPTVHGATLEDRFYNNDSFKQQEIDPSDPQQQEAALKIQTQFRKHAAEKEVAHRKEEEAAVKIQSTFRGHQDREKVKRLRSLSHEQRFDFDLNDPEVQNAAVKIQAGFKGFKARQEVQAMKAERDSLPHVHGNIEQKDYYDGFMEEDYYNEQEDDSVPAEEEFDIDENDPEKVHAATRIQANFRGFKTRQMLKKQEAEHPEDEDRLIQKF